MPSSDEGAGARAARSGVSDNGVSAAGRARVAEIQRARLVAAMVEVAAEQSFVGATVARVVSRAGVSRRTFYELFADREDCFLAGFDEVVRQASRYVLEAYDPQVGWAERLRTAVTGLLSFLDVKRGAGQLLVAGSLGAGPRALERRGRVLAQMIAFVDEGRTVARAGAEPPPLTAEGVVGGALSVVHTRMAQGGRARGGMVELVSPLVSMIVLPYLGPAVARKELERPIQKPRARVERAGEDPLRELGMRLTYRTVRVLMSVAALGGRGSYPSNREVGLAAGVADQGQISKLLTRLERLGLVHNTGLAPGKGAPNAWALTEKGLTVERAMGTDGARDAARRTRSRR
jgi:AcrR family transcriptional regulator